MERKRKRKKNRKSKRKDGVLEGICVKNLEM